MELQTEDLIDVVAVLELLVRHQLQDCSHLHQGGLNQIPQNKIIPHFPPFVKQYNFQSSS